MLEKKNKTIHLIAGVLALALILIVGHANAQTSTPPAPTPPKTTPAGDGQPIPHTLIGHTNCLKCHGEGFSDALIIPADHISYINDECQDCHELSVIVVPIPALPPGDVPAPLDHPAAEGMNSCFDCHVLLDEKHEEISETWQESVHGQANIGCVGCHGGDPRTDEMNLSMIPEAGFIGTPAREFVPYLCGGCHSDVERMGQYNLPTDQYTKYIESVHGSKLLEEGDTEVALCTDCHGSHDIKRASDPTSDVYPLNVPALCAGCHADAELMEPYGIPTNQYEVYETSIHGEVLLGEQDMRAPTCASCHGSHAAKPPSDAEVVNVCGKCHTATQAYFEESLHSRLEDNAPRCWTCHGTHDVAKPDESMFLNPTPLESSCGTCHIDEEAFRMDKTRFALPENRRCDTCHHEDSWIIVQVKALHNNLTDASQAYEEAEEAIEQAAARGMIVSEAEVKLAESLTSLISARATFHTTKLPRVNDLTDEAKESAETARELATEKLGENLFRRQAMVVALGFIMINITILLAYKRQLDRQLD